MSGYIGNPDAEAEHALILAENGIHDAQQSLVGPIRSLCVDCGEEIPKLRVEFARRKNIRCETCVDCESQRELIPKRRTRMLDRIL